MDHLFTEWPPLPSSGGLTITPRLLSNHFKGDVTTDVVDGINAARHTYQATWLLHQDSADRMMSFLHEHACRAFVWAAPRDAVERVWEATDWSRTTQDVDQDIIQVTFEERFMAVTPPPPLPPPPGLFFRLGSSPLGGPIGLL